MSKYCKSDDPNCGCITWMENKFGPGKPFMMGRFKPGHEPDGWLIFDKHHFMPPPTLDPKKMAELFRMQQRARESEALRIKNWGTADPPIMMGGERAYEVFNG